MILILCGMSCSGKSSVQKILAENYDYSSIVTYTSRPMRDNEQEGIDYHFVTSEVFQSLEESDFFIESTSFTVASGDVWYYGTSKQSLEEAEPDSVIIANPHGLEKIIENIGKENLCICYITTNEKEILTRMQKRGDDKEECIRRIAADKNDFDFVRDNADIVIANNGDESLEKIAFDVDMYYRIYKAGK